jgi:hypothetical protein
MARSGNRRSSTRTNRASVALLMLLVVCGLSAKRLCKLASQLPTTDWVSIAERRYSLLRPELPATQIVCFISAEGIPGGDAAAQFFVAQYSVAPVLVELASPAALGRALEHTQYAAAPVPANIGSYCHFAIGYFTRSNSMVNPAYELVRQAADGVSLFRRKNE